MSLKKKLFLMLSLIVMLVAPATDVWAINDQSCAKGISQTDCDALNGNWSAWIPDDGDSSCTSGSVALSGTGNKAKIWNFLTSKGLSAVQAAGVMGNMQAESGFSPARQEDSKTFPEGGWGLAQWTFGRRTSLVKVVTANPQTAALYDNKYGRPASDSNGNLPPGMSQTDNDNLLALELNFLYEESNARPVNAKGFGSGPNEWAVMKQQTTVENATVFWHNNFEVSNDSADTVIKNRGGAAQAIYTTFSGDTSGGSNTSAQTATANSTDACANSLVGGNFSSYVKNYAWPDFKGEGFITPMPAYADAIAKAKAAGQYTGYGVADCGAFVTRIVIDSGLDPTFNYNGSIKNGAGNTDTEQTWIAAHWQKLGTGNSIDTGTLQAGDVAEMPGHTFIYVGTVDGFNSKLASASGGGDGDTTNRVPMAGRESLTGSSVTWYRKQATDG